MDSDNENFKALAQFLETEELDFPDSNINKHNFLEKKEVESTVKQSLNEPKEPAKGTFSDFFKSLNSVHKPKIVDLHEPTNKHNTTNKESTPKTPKFGFDPSVDPIFGLRIINPILSSQAIKDNMSNKTPVPVSRVKTFVTSGDISSDWVIAGVLVNKSLPKTSQKGTTFSIWKLSDLKPGMNTITLFLFGKSHADLWKTDIGSVVGVLNPKELDSKDRKDGITLSINSGDQVMVWGRSKDYGTCKGVKKNGEKCDMFVNINDCDVCTYHVKREYIKHCGQRANLGNSRPTAAHSLRDKVLGKNEVFYGGKSFVSTKANHSKLMKEDQAKLQRLTPANKQNTVNLANPLSIPSSTTVASRRSTAIREFVDNLKTNELTGSGKKNLDYKEASPMCTFKDLLGNSTSSNNFGSQRKRCAKANALEYIKSKGPIQKENPNLFEKNNGGKKRKMPEDIVLDLENGKKVAKEEKISQRFLELMNSTSQNQELIDIAQQEAEDKYFDDMDRKEKLEQKMMNTYKMPCKAVRCIVCKYTWFSASEWCKAQKHALRVTDATKRFFKCGDCNSRTVCLTMFPLISCKNCSSSKWERAPMMAHKKVDEVNLSIRGDEQSYLSAMQPKLSLGLLVPNDN
ncbi:protein MCM10 homolog [Daktulosphaira vitifoliae]|uniref:protein MCM10 homolog n=1 Tax=Daktulosphaira vitifoliae TaxID=58002 RepID=UPI0021AADCD9|nr:protein MCM10 homolog [Daktulosphaira vitifoliae]